MHSFSHSRAVGAYSGLDPVMGNVHGHSAHGNAEKGTAGPAGAWRGEGGHRMPGTGTPVWLNCPKALAVPASKEQRTLRRSWVLEKLSGR